MAGPEDKRRGETEMAEICLEQRQAFANAAEACWNAAGRCAEAGEHTLAKKLRKEGDRLWKRWDNG